MDCPTNTSNNMCCPSEFDQSRVDVLRAILKQAEGRRQILEEKSAKHSRVKAEVVNINRDLENLQVMMEDIKKSYQKSYNSLVQDFDAVLMECEQKSKLIAQMKQKCNELQCALRSKTCNELSLIEEIKKLELIKSKSIACNEGIQVKICKTKKCVESLQREAAELESTLACKTQKLEGARRELADLEVAVRGHTARLNELQREAAECCRALRDMVATCRDREAKLSAFRDAAPPQVEAAERAVAVARTELAEASATATEWTGKRERADAEHKRLVADGASEACRSRAVLREYGDERDRLTDRLAETSVKLIAAVADNRSLAAAAKTDADRLTRLTAELDRLGQRAYHERLVRAARLTGCDAGIAPSASVTAATTDDDDQSACCRKPASNGCP